MFSIIFIICVLFSCINNDIIISGCREGLLVWYNSALPVILPFLLLTSFYTSYLSSKDISRRSAVTTMLITGLFCGFPTGALTCCDLLGSHKTDRRTVYALMPLCNNISPMFLFGYIYPLIKPSGISIPHMLICLYVPELLFFLTYIFIHKRSSISTAPKTSPGKEPDDPLMSSVKAITLIGIYIIIFSIISGIIGHISDHDSYVNYILPMLEITKGSLLLEALDLSANIKTALIIFLTSFGGLCAILQAGHFLRKSGLSLSFYTASKIICAAASVLLHLLLTYYGL